MTTGERKIARRGVLGGLGAAAVAGAGGFSLARFLPGGQGGSRDGDIPSGPASSGTDGAAPASDPAPALPRGHIVDGVTHPAVPQRHTRIAVVSLKDRGTVKERLGAAVAVDGTLPSDAGTPSLVLGVAPALAAELWPVRVKHRDALPGFGNDAADIVTGGDVYVQVSAETVSAATERQAAVLAVLGGELVWHGAGYRDAPTSEGVTRAGIGFLDGIINPRDAKLLDAGVWIEGGKDTYLVIRRMHIAESFTSQPVAAQEAAIGRKKTDGAPLSGGTGMDQVDLFAKSPEGRLLTPAGSHARRAHPSNIGRALMLRRSYTLASEGSGLLFLAFMNDPTTFVMTQRRLDEQDDLISHTSTDASGVFYVPESGAL